MHEKVFMLSTVLLAYPCSSCSQCSLVLINQEKVNTKRTLTGIIERRKHYSLELLL